MAKAKRDPSHARSPYHRDFFAWTRQQAALLRRAAAGERTSDLDLLNLAEEIESLGERDRRALLSQIARVIEHLLKLQYSQAEESRPGWESSVDVAVRRLGGSWRTAQASKPSWRPSLARAMTTADALPREHGATSSMARCCLRFVPTASTRSSTGTGGRFGTDQSAAAARDAVAHAEELLAAAVAQLGAGQHEQRLERLVDRVSPTAAIASSGARTVEVPVFLI